jgi:hypothetical protein
MDARTVIYAAYGVVIDSELALPLPEQPPSADAGPHVRILRGTVPTTGVRFAPVTGIDDDEDVWLAMGWLDDRTVLQFSDVAAELVDDRVTVDPLDLDDPDYLAHMVLDHIVPRWLALHGDVVLHAGAVVSPHGNAVAMIGDPGQGKSTMTAGLGLAGWRVLGDDACRLVRAGDDWLAHPSYPGARLLSDSRAALVPSVPSTPMADGAGKHRVIGELPFATKPARLVAILELGDDSPSSSLQAMSFSQATAGLTRHSFILAPRLSEVASRAFTLSSSLASDVICMRLNFPRRWDVYPDVVKLLEDLAGSAP